MLVMVVEKVTPSLRGGLSRWLIEVGTGVYVGHPSARVRDELWDMALKKCVRQGAITQIWTARTPQGFRYRQFGEVSRKFQDFEGLALTLLPPKRTRKKVAD